MNCTHPGTAPLQCRTPTDSGRRFQLEVSARLFRYAPLQPLARTALEAFKRMNPPRCRVHLPVDIHERLEIQCIRHS